MFYFNELGREKERHAFISCCAWAMPHRYYLEEVMKTQCTLKEPSNLSQWHLIWGKKLAEYGAFGVFFPNDYNCQVCVYQDLREISNSVVDVLLNQEHFDNTAAGPWFWVTYSHA